MARLSYSEKKNNSAEAKILTLAEEMPRFIFDYIAFLQNTKTSATRLAYLRDIRTFLLFYGELKPLYNGLPIKQMNENILSTVTTDEIETYLTYLNEYTQDGKKQKCNSAGKHRKLASIRSLFKYMLLKGYIIKDPSRGISVPVENQFQEELSDNDISVILSEIIYGSHLSKRQMQFHDRIVKRDQAIVYLLASTGITLTELVSLDFDDLNLHSSYVLGDDRFYALNITRKSGTKEAILITSLCKDYLLNYLDEREEQFPGRTDAGDPLFISLQGYRMSANAVHEMIKRYTRSLFPNRKINCKMFRATRNLRLLREVQDVKLISELLGQKEKTALIYQKKLMKAAQIGQPIINIK